MPRSGCFCDSEPSQLRQTGWDVPAAFPVVILQKRRMERKSGRSDEKMNWLVSFAVAFASAVIASMGIGGGTVLLLFLTVFSDTPLPTAQGINLLFFLPVGAAALLFHKKSGLLQVKKGMSCGLWGLPGVFLGVWIASRLESSLLSKLFAVFLFYLGVKTLFSKDAGKPQNKQ